MIRRSLMVAAMLVAVAPFAPPARAQSSGAFAGMAGNWSGSGVITLDDGSKERLRCRAGYEVAGAQMSMTLTCASDAYKFQLTANVVDQGGAVSGSWSETTRAVVGTLQGRGGNGNFQVVASAAGVSANISLKTAGNKQTISMTTDTQFRNATISLSK